MRKKDRGAASKIVSNLSPIGKDVVLHAHLWCAGEKGKPVVRRGRKASMGLLELALGGGQATEQQQRGTESSAPRERKEGAGAASHQTHSYDTSASPIF
jgi:hypothetical protein